MSVAQDALLSPRPWVIGDFVRRTRVITGDESTGSQRKGITDLAYNANTLMANLRKPLVTDCQDSSVVLTLTTSFQTFAWYVIRTANYSGRTSVTTQVRVGTTTGGTYEVRVSFIPVSGSTVTATYSGTAASGGWAIATATGLLLNEVYIVKLEARYTVSGGSWNPWLVYLEQDANISGSLSGMTWDLEGVHPLDVAQYGEDEALSVIMARECIHNNNVLFANQVNAVVTMGNWHIHTTGTTSAITIGLQSWYGPTITFGGMAYGGTSAGKIKEWVYWPRPGVTSLSVYVNGFVNAWASGADTANFRLCLENSDTSQINFTLASAAANYAVGSWVVFGSTMTVPDTGGPVKIQLWGGFPTAGKPGYIQTLVIAENPLSTPAYG